MKTTSVAFILLFLNFTTGCHYYKVQNATRVTMDELQQYDSAGKYLILHEADTAYHLGDLRTEGRVFSGSISPLPEIHQKYKTTLGHKSNRYLKRASLDESDVIREVHLHVTDLMSKTDSTISGSPDAINYIEVFIKDKRKSRNSWMLPLILIPVVGGFAVFLYALGKDAKLSVGANVFGP